MSVTPKARLKFAPLVSLLLAVACASAPQTVVTRSPANTVVAKKKLILFVHGFGGNKVIERQIQKALLTGADPVRASVGEFNAFYDVFQRYLKERNRTDFSFAAFKFDTRKQTDVKAAEVLAKSILGKSVPEKIAPFNNQIPEDLSEVRIITLSNGNLVVRRTVLKAIEEANAEVLRFFSMASIFDISPILGGAADARGTLPVAGRFREIDPFGTEMQKVFSDRSIGDYDRAVEGRHFTYFICGDPFTRGVWDQWLKVREHPFYESALHLSALVQGKSWVRKNRNWYHRFENARGRDSDHHIEFVPDLAANSYCSVKEYLSGLDRFLKQSNSGMSERTVQRRALGPQDYFMRRISADSGDFMLDAFNDVYPLGQPTHEKFFLGIDPQSGQLEALHERHTALVYYKPLIRIIGEKIFGSDFTAWFDQSKI